MALSRLAGKPASKEMLIDLNRLEQACYTVSGMPVASVLPANRSNSGMPKAGPCRATSVSRF